MLISTVFNNEDWTNLIVLIMEIQFTKKELDIRSVKINSHAAGPAAFLFAMTLLILAAADLFGQNNEPQTGQIAPELVGKWCFINLTTNTADAVTNSCITLNADGTFEVSLDRATLPNAASFSGLQNSDYGKWWVTGNRIFYNSATNGQGSFAFQKMNHPHLENMPLVVINGISFATASSHEAW
jgi:hypothetical protein